MFYKFDRKFIHHQRLVLYLLLHIVPILIIAAAAGGLFTFKSYHDQKAERAAVLSKYPDGIKTVRYTVTEVEKAALQNYATQSRRRDDQAEYNYSSAYMQIDHRNVQYIIGRFLMVPDSETFLMDEAIAETLGFFKTDECMQYVADMVNKRDLGYTPTDIRELITFLKDGQNITVTVMSPSEEISGYIFNAVKSYWRLYVVRKVSSSQGTFRLKLLQSYSYSASDKTVRDNQEAFVNRAQTFATQAAATWDLLESDAKKYYNLWVTKEGIPLGDPIEEPKTVDIPAVSKRAAVMDGIKGGFAGLAGALFLFAVLFWCSQKIWNINDVGDSYTIPGGEWRAKNASMLHKKMPFLWDADNKIREKAGGFLSDEELRFQLESWLKDPAGEMLILSDAIRSDSLFAEAFLKKYGNVSARTRLISYQELLTADFREILNNAGSIVLMEPAGVTTFSAFSKGLLKIFHFHDRIAGAIIVS